MAGTFVDSQYAREGDMMVRVGDQWKVLQKGSEDQILVMGSDGKPEWRDLLYTDIPNLPYYKIQLLGRVLQDLGLLHLPSGETVSLHDEVDEEFDELIPK